MVFRTEKGTFNYRVAGVWIVHKHVLLHKDVNDTNWSLPGGRVKLGEESEAALIREFQEELNLDIRVHRMNWIIENFFTYKEKNFHEIGLYYRVSSDRNIPIDKQGAFYGVEGERLIYKWIPIDMLNEIELYPQCLKSAIKEIPAHTEHLVERQ